MNTNTNTVLKRKTSNYLFIKMKTYLERENPIEQFMVSGAERPTERSRRRRRSSSSRKINAGYHKARLTSAAVTSAIAQRVVEAEESKFTCSRRKLLSATSKISKLHVAIFLAAWTDWCRSDVDKWRNVVTRQAESRCEFVLPRCNTKSPCENYP